jgi:hypothetical protein
MGNKECRLILIITKPLTKRIISHLHSSPLPLYFSLSITLQSAQSYKCMTSLLAAPPPTLHFHSVTCQLGMAAKPSLIEFLEVYLQQGFNEDVVEVDENAYSIGETYKGKQGE